MSDPAEFVCPIDGNPDLRTMEGDRLACSRCGNWYTVSFLRDTDPEHLASMRRA